jgi:transcriptional regulator with XRE-family HTH domain
MRLTQPLFHGPRLREAREARALSQTALADLLDVSASSVSQYESGDQIPSPHVMARICEKLNMPPQFFMTPRMTKRTSALFWRSHSAATKRAREAHERKYDWFRDAVSLLAGYLEFPAPNFPDFAPPPDPSVITDDDVEDYAVRTRRFWG